MVTDVADALCSSSHSKIIRYIYNDFIIKSQLATMMVIDLADARSHRPTVKLSVTSVMSSVARYFTEIKQR